MPEGHFKPPAKPPLIQTIRLFRVCGDQITNMHLRKLASEGWYVVDGRRVDDRSGFEIVLEKAQSEV